MDFDRKLLLPPPGIPYNELISGIPFVFRRETGYVFLKTDDGNYISLGNGGIHKIEDPHLVVYPVQGRFSWKV